MLAGPHGARDRFPRACGAGGEVLQGVGREPRNACLRAVGSRLSAWLTPKGGAGFGQGKPVAQVGARPVQGGAGPAQGDARLTLGCVSAGGAQEAGREAEEEEG